MDIQGLVTADITDARNLVFRTPGGEVPKVVFDRHVALKPVTGWNLCEDGVSFRLTYVPDGKVRAAI
jgi:hypothetical protein